MFPGQEIAQVAGFLAWAASRGWDTYHAQAAFTTAEPNGFDKRGNQKFKGERRGANVQRLRSFWIDLDVKRAGDKKAAATCYASLSDALTWLGGFRRALNLPRLSIAVQSGYGLHAYWTLEDPVTAQDWQPYADALKAALLAHGFRGDAGISADSVRLLRPPGTVNMKSGTPVPVAAIDRLSGPDVPNAFMLACLQPYVGQIVSRTTNTAQVQMAGQASALAGGGSNVSSIFQAAGVATNMAQAATANLPQLGPERLFARMAEPGACAQVATSLASGGAGDAYPLWYLGFLSAAGYCSDGAQFIHPISQGDPRYTPQATDAAMARIVQERARKPDLGWPSCTLFERSRPAVCQACPHYGRLTSPLDLAVEHGDLPRHYRRARGGIERWVESGKEAGGFWVPVVRGDVFGPRLDRNPGRGYELAFKYLCDGTTYDINVVAGELSTESSSIYKMMQQQDMVLLPGNELAWRTFVLSWVEQLRSKGAARTEKINPFGWAKNGPKHVGFALAGTLYRADGATESAPGGDRAMLELHTAQGELTEWQRAAAFATAGRPDLQVIVAASFAAPLVRFTGQKGLLLSAWSSDSGVGKSSALTVGQAVWGDARAGMTHDDTYNNIRAKIAETHNLPAYWDEMRVLGGNADEMAKFVSFIFALTQGKDKGRLDRDATIKPIGEWETMLIGCANRPLMDSVVTITQGTEAGALRLFEFQISHPQIAQNAHASAIIQLANEHYGRAGHIYAAWLATHFEKARDLVLLITQDMITKTQAAQNERMHTATMASILAGARIARSLGLVDFDLPAMEGLLLATFRSLRAARGAQLLVGPKGYDIEELLGAFWAENMRSRLVTDKFGYGNTKIEVVLHPISPTGVDIQVSQQDQMMRVVRSKFYDFLRRRGLPPTVVLDSMTRVWGATQARRTYGSGTPYGTGGNIWSVEIPLTRPELQDYLQATPPAVLSSASRASALQAPPPAAVQALGATP